MSRAKEWSVRLYHEAKRHADTAFLTLTFSDQFLPDNFSVCTRDLQLFLKRYRKWLGHNRLRYFACGEYGDRNYRPHYHLAIFGHSFKDQVPWRQTKTGFVTYRSAQLEKLWPYGHCEIGTLTPQSAGYIARYITKKIGGDMAADHYKRIHPITGQECQVTPEFLCMSNRPGIGHYWFEEYEADAFPSDFLIMDGKKVPVPRYYMKKLQAREKPENDGEAQRFIPGQSFKIKQKRKEKGVERASDNTDSRLLTKEESLNLKLSRLARDLGEHE